MFPEHLPLSTIQTGLKTGKYLQVCITCILYLNNAVLPEAVVSLGQPSQKHALP